jgi:hypothetical protein
MWLTLPDAVDPRVDVYSLGVILYRLLTLELPFSGDSLQAKFVAATSAERPSLHQRRPDLPMNVDLWVERALAIEPGDRFPTVRALWAELLWALERGPHPHESKRKKAVEPRELKRIREWLQAPLGALPNPLGAAWRAAAGVFSRLRWKAPSEAALPAPTAGTPEPTVQPEPEPSGASRAPQAPGTAEAEDRDRDTVPDSPQASERAGALQAARDEAETLLRVVSVQPPDASEADGPTPVHEDSGEQRSINREEETRGVDRETPIAPSSDRVEREAPSSDRVEREAPSSEAEQSAEIATVPRRASKKIATRKRGPSVRPPTPAQTSETPAPAATKAKKAGKKTATKKATTSNKGLSGVAIKTTTSKKVVERVVKKTKASAASASSKSKKVAKATKKVAKKATRKTVARRQTRSSKVRGNSATTSQKKRPTKKRARVSPKSK